MGGCICFSKYRPVSLIARQSASRVRSSGEACYFFALTANFTARPFRPVTAQDIAKPHSTVPSHPSVVSDAARLEGLGTEGRECLQIRPQERHPHDLIGHVLLQKEPGLRSEQWSQRRHTGGRSCLLDPSCLPSSSFGARSKLRKASNERDCW